MTLNLGSGHGQSVLEVVQAMEAASGHLIPYAITDCRPGDAAISVADLCKAARRLGGAPSAALSRSAAAAGPGSSRTLRDMSDEVSWC